MKTLLKLVGWITSFFAALAGVILSVAAISKPLEWPAALACFIFALAVNPLAIRKIQLLHKPVVVAAVAIGAFVLGIASLIGSVAHDTHLEAQKAAEQQRAAAAAQKAEADKTEAAFKTLVTSMMPMDDATYALVRTLATADVDPNDAAGLRAYFTAQMTLNRQPGDTDQAISKTADDLVKMAQSDPNIRASMTQLNSTSQFARTMAVIDRMKAQKGLATIK